MILTINNIAFPQAKLETLNISTLILGYEAHKEFCKTYNWVRFDVSTEAEAEEVKALVYQKLYKGYNMNYMEEYGSLFNSRAYDDPKKGFSVSVAVQSGNKGFTNPSTISFR
jgi:hypothetical protein